MTFSEKKWCRDELSKTHLAWHENEAKFFIRASVFLATQVAPDVKHDDDDDVDVGGTVTSQLHVYEHDNG